MENPPARCTYDYEARSIRFQIEARPGDAQARRRALEVATELVLRSDEFARDFALKQGNVPHPLQTTETQFIFATKEDGQEKEPEFFERCVQHAELREAVADYVRAVIQVSFGDPPRPRPKSFFWSNCETPLGTYAIEPLLLVDARRYLRLYQNFLLTNDMDHEVTQHEFLARLMEAEGWHEGTLELAAQRWGLSCGQFGHEDFRFWCEKLGLREALLEEGRLEAFLRFQYDHWLPRFLGGGHTPQPGHALGSLFEHVIAWFTELAQCLFPDDEERARKLADRLRGELEARYPVQR